MKKLKALTSVTLAAAMALTMTACDEEAPTSTANSGAPVASAVTTTATTTTFAENQEVNNAVAQITDGLEYTDIEVTKRIKWMGHFDIDETFAAAILFKKTYGVPTEGDDPESEGRIFEYSYVGYEERYEKLGAAIASGDSPDLFPFDYQDYPYGVLRGRYQPIDTIIDFDGAKWSATKELMDQYKLNGRYYCAFWELSLNNLMYYRKSMIEEIGAEDPRDLFEKGNWNWDTFLDIARKWQESGDGRYVIDGYFPENDFVISTGVPLVGNDGTKLFHNLKDPAVERAEDLLITLYQENLRYPRHELNGWSINPKAWADGDILFHADGSLWVWEERLGKYAKKNGWADDEVKIVPFPKDPQADKYYVTLNEESYMWVKGSTNENGVKAWIDCIQSAIDDINAVIAVN